MITIEEITRRHPSMKDLIDYLKGMQVGEYLPGERVIADAVGWHRATVREHMRAIECFGHVFIQHGKPIKLIKGF